MEVFAAETTLTETEVTLNGSYILHMSGSLGGNIVNVYTKSADDTEYTIYTAISELKALRIDYSGDMKFEIISPNDGLRRNINMNLTMYLDEIG